MRILYVFPHPDDESFGPARAMAAQRRQGHDVHLLTLTRGEATKVRHTLGWTLEQMGAARHRELEAVAATLDLTGLRVLTLPDSGLKELDRSAVVVSGRSAPQSPGSWKCRVANARPEPDLRYFSKRAAAFSVRNSIETRSDHGRYRTVWPQGPSLCHTRRPATSLVRPM
jgi:hypothetical protein